MSPSRARTVTGLLAGALMVLSAFAHSALGWSQLGGELARARVPADLLFAIKAGWEFGGIAMLAFGAVVIVHAVSRLRGGAGYPLPVGIIAATYVAFGAWALVASGFRPFFLVFVVPGVLLALAVSGRDAA